MGTGNFNELSVNSRINIGANTLIFENNPGGQINSIYTNTGILKIQATSFDNHTIINSGNLGKVGIGVDETFFTNHLNAEKVTIAGNLMIKGDGGFDNSDEEAILYLGDDNHYIKSIHGGGLRIGTFEAEDAIILMQSNGFVGIGTNNPQKSLHVKDIKNLSIPPDQIVALDPIPGNPFDDNNYDPTIEAKGSLRLELVAGPGNQAIWDIEPVTSLINTPFPANKLYIGPKNKTIPVMALNYDGKVGIGTTNPNEQLQIGDRWTFHNGESKVIGYNYCMINNVEKRITNGYASQIRFNNNGSIEFRTTAVSGSPNSLIEYDNKPALYISKKGSVGICIAVEDDNNTNNYKLAVNGKIGAKEVFIEIQQTPWPDYVFDKDYKIMPIKELELFIKTNNHLPDIPTAIEIKEKGLPVGEMNALLLRKIEELTLYIILQQKILEQHQKEIQLLKENHK